MIDTLSNLTDSQKQAAITLACQVIASTTDSRINTLDEDLIALADAFFPRPDTESAMQFLQAGIQNGCDWCTSTVSSFTEEEKRAFRFIISNICHNNAMRVATAGLILSECGFQPVSMKKDTQPTDERQYGIEQEEHDRGSSIAKCARLVDVSAIRGECNEIFTLYVGDDPQPINVPANFEDWLSKELCPSAGMVGILAKERQTSEGKLYFISFRCKDKYIIVPTLSAGFENIEQYEWMVKGNNNFILAHDKGGSRCRSLREGIFEKKASPLYKDDSLRIVFRATKQDRFEPGKYFPTSFVQRIITFDYNEMHDEVEINVKGVMRPKYARIVSDNGRVLTYKDTSNPMVRYEIETGSENQIIRFSMIVDFPKIEYRYTI